MGSLVEKYMKGLGYNDITDFTEDLFRDAWSGGYPRWRVLKPVIEEQGWDLATDEGYAKYLEYCEPIFRMTQFTDRAMKELGLKEIKDIPTMGRILKQIWNNAFLCPTDVVEETPDRTVVRTMWCGNPAHGPSPFAAHDSIFSYHEFYRLFDAGLTRDLGLSGLVEEAKKRGLKEDIEFEMPWAMCRDGDAPYCLYVMRKRGTPKYELPPLTDREKAWFIGHEIEKSGQKPMIYISKMLGKTIEELAEAILVLYVALDMGMGYVAPEIAFGKDKALDMYTKYRLSLLYHWFKEAKFALEIGKVTTVRELAELINFCERKKFIPYKISEEGKQITLIAHDDPFAEISTKFLGQRNDAAFFEAVAKADDAFINQIIVDSKMSDRAKITVMKRLVKGDDKNEIVIEEG